MMLQTIFIVLVLMGQLVLSPTAKATDQQEAICDTAAVFYCENFEMHSTTQNDQNLSGGAYKSQPFVRSHWPNGNAGASPSTYGINMNVIDSTAKPEGVYLGTRAFEGTYAAGSNTGPGYMDAVVSPAKTDVYLRWYTKYSSAWEFSSVATKHMEFRLAGSNATPQLMWVGTPIAGRASMYPRIFEYYSGLGDNYTFQQNVGTAILGRDTWYCLEVHHKMQTNSTTTDGIIEAWVDGVKILNYNPVIIDNRGGNSINSLLVSHYWNCSSTCTGSANDTHPLQYRWLDNIVMSTSPIGCLDAPASTPTRRFAPSINLRRAAVPSDIHLVTGAFQ